MKERTVLGKLGEGIEGQTVQSITVNNKEFDFHSKCDTKCSNE